MERHIVIALVAGVAFLLSLMGRNWNVLGISLVAEFVNALAFIYQSLGGS